MREMNRKVIFILVGMIVVAALIVAFLVADGNRASVKQEPETEESAQDNSSILPESGQDGSSDDQSSRIPEDDELSFDGLAEHELPPVLLEPTEPPDEDSSSNEIILSQGDTQEDTTPERENSSSEDTVQWVGGNAQGELPPDSLD